MKTILSTDGTIGEVIDLTEYLSLATRQLIAALYKLHGWPFEPPDAWIWKYADVCALYFRLRRHADLLGSDPEQARVLGAIETAINHCLADEFS